MEAMKINNAFGDMGEKLKIFANSVKIAFKEEKGISNIFKRIDEEYYIRETKYMLRQIQLEYLEDLLHDRVEECYEEDEFDDCDFYEDYKKDVEWSKKNETIENMKKDVILTVESIKLDNYEILDDMYKSIINIDDFDKLTEHEIKEIYFNVALPYYYDI